MLYPGTALENQVPRDVEFSNLGLILGLILSALGSPATHPVPTLDNPISLKA